jgi:hypothetical protein
MIRRANRFTISSKSRGFLGSDMADMSRARGVPLTSIIWAGLDILATRVGFDGLRLSYPSCNLIALFAEGHPGA